MLVDVRPRLLLPLSDRFGPFDLVLKVGHFPLPIIVSANADGSQGNSRTLSAFLWQAECVILAGK